MTENIGNMRGKRNAATRDARPEYVGALLELGRSVPSARNARGGRNHRSWPSPAGGSSSVSMQQIPPFLKARGCFAPISLAAISPIDGMWPTSATARSLPRRPSAAISASSAPSGSQRVDGDQRGETPDTCREDPRRLPRADERARQHAVEAHLELPQSQHLHPQALDPLAGERAIIVIRELGALFSGHSMTHQVDEVRSHQRAPRRSGTNRRTRSAPATTAAQADSAAAG